MINKKILKNLILSDIRREIILQEDSISLENVETDYVNEYRYFSEEGKKFIDKNFLEIKAENEHIFNGELIGLRNFDMYGGKIFISYERGDYKTYLATKASPYKTYISNNEAFIVPIGVVSIMVTRDNYIVLGHPKGEKYKLVGGYVSSSDMTDGKMDFLKTAIREAREEVGKEIELNNGLLLGIYILDCGCAMVISHRIDLNRSDIENIWHNNRNPDRYEMDNMIFLRNREEDLGNAIKNTDYSANARIAFKFHLKTNFSNYRYVNVKVEE